jgi:hypothetical protein
MPEYRRWEDVRRELGFDAWKAAHPWRYRRIKFRSWLRVKIWKLTRIDIG